MPAKAFSLSCGATLQTIEFRYCFNRNLKSFSRRCLFNTMTCNSNERPPPGFFVRHAVKSLETLLFTQKRLRSSSLFVKKSPTHAPFTVKSDLGLLSNAVYFLRLATMILTFDPTASGCDFIILSREMRCEWQKERKTSLEIYA